MKIVVIFLIMILLFGCVKQSEPSPQPSPAPPDTPSQTPTPSPRPIWQPSPQPTPQPTPTPFPSPTPTPVPTPQPMPSPQPLPAPTPQPLPTPFPQPTGNFKITSDSFNDGGLIPKRYTCDGGDVRPHLRITNAPAETKSFAIIVDDPQLDAPNGAWLHWTVWNIPANTRDLPEGERIGVEGATESLAPGYYGPCPPAGPAHIYRFRIYALDTILDLDEGAGLLKLQSAMDGHVLAEAELDGVYGLDEISPTPLPTPTPSPSGIPSGASTKCSDSEAGDDPLRVGTVTVEYAEYGSSVYQTYGTWSDSCMSSSAVQEVFCDSTKPDRYSTKSVACPTGKTCSGGKCGSGTTPSPSPTPTPTPTPSPTPAPAPPPSPSTCTDSDNGKIYTIKGTTKKGTTTNIDWCFTSNPKILNEYYCESNDIKSETYTCSNTCSDGKCTGSTPTPSPTPECTSKYDCGYKQICKSGACVSVQCTNDAHCSSYCPSARCGDDNRCDYSWC